MDPSATKWHSACGARSTPNKYIQKIQTQNKTQKTFEKLNQKSGRGYSK